LWRSNSCSRKCLRSVVLTIVPQPSSSTHKLSWLFCISCAAHWHFLSQRRRFFVTDKSRFERTEQRRLDLERDYISLWVFYGNHRSINAPFLVAGTGQTDRRTDGQQLRSVTSNCKRQRVLLMSDNQSCVVVVSSARMLLLKLNVRRVGWGWPGLKSPACPPADSVYSPPRPMFGKWTAPIKSLPRRQFNSTKSPRRRYFTWDFTGKINLGGRSRILPD